jgi:hypothetical protein
LPGPLEPALRLPAGGDDDGRMDCGTIEHSQAGLFEPVAVSSEQVLPGVANQELTPLIARRAGAFSRAVRLLRGPWRQR